MNWSKEVTRRDFLKLWLSVWAWLWTSLLLTPLISKASIKTVQAVNWIMSWDTDPDKVQFRESTLELSKLAKWKHVPVWARIWIISDLHIGEFNTNSIKQLDQILWLNLDALIIVWDFLFQNTTNINEYYWLLDNLLKRIRCQVFATLWNHDYIVEWNYVHYNKNLLNYLKSRWIKLLNNSTEELIIKWERVNFIWKGSNLRWNFQLETRLLENKWINILVTHEPIWFSLTQDWFELWIAGHTHWCPEWLIYLARMRSILINQTIWFNKFDLKYNNWLYTLPDKYLLTSSWIGRHWAEKNFTQRYIDVVNIA